MCTLSWLRSAGAYTVFFNRDEARSRAPAEPPRLLKLTGVPVLAPIDGDAGGTWIGVNGHGVTVALSNRYEETPIDPPTSPVSRGLLVLSLLGVADLATLRKQTGSILLSNYRPFTIAGFSPVEPPMLIEWNGTRIGVRQVDRSGLVVTSSGHDQAGAERVRRQVFDSLEPLTVEALVRAHRSHLPVRGPLSICMHRPEASTVSMVQVTVNGRHAVMRYVPGPPGEGAPSITAELDLLQDRTGKRGSDA